MKNEASEGSSWSSELGEEIEEMCSLTMQQVSQRNTAAHDHSCAAHDRLRSLRLIWFPHLFRLVFPICQGAHFYIGTSIFVPWQAMAGQPAPFAVNYSLGNIIALCSTGFLVGCTSCCLLASSWCYAGLCRQLQNITTGHRLLCSVGYLGLAVQARGADELFGILAQKGVEPGKNGRA